MDFVCAQRRFWPFRERICGRLGRPRSSQADHCGDEGLTALRQETGGMQHLSPIPARGERVPGRRQAQLAQGPYGAAGP